MEMKNINEKKRRIAHNKISACEIHAVGGDIVTGIMNDMDKTFKRDLQAEIATNSKLQQNSVKNNYPSPAQKYPLMQKTKKIVKNLQHNIKNSKKQNAHMATLPSSPDQYWQIASPPSSPERYSPIASSSSPDQNAPIASTSSPDQNAPTASTSSPDQYLELLLRSSPNQYSSIASTSSFDQNLPPNKKFKRPKVIRNKVINQPKQRKKTFKKPRSNLKNNANSEITFNEHETLRDFENEIPQLTNIINEIKSELKVKYLSEITLLLAQISSKMKNAPDYLSKITIYVDSISEFENSVNCNEN